MPNRTSMHNSHCVHMLPPIQGHPVGCQTRLHPSTHPAIKTIEQQIH